MEHCSILFICRAGAFAQARWDKCCWAGSHLVSAISPPVGFIAVATCAHILYAHGLCLYTCSCESLAAGSICRQASGQCAVNQARVGIDSYFASVIPEVVGRGNHRHSHVPLEHQHAINKYSGGKRWRLAMVGQKKFGHLRQAWT